MTKINRLYLHGFKSFAKKTEVVFGNSFNCVLGPNGSGKSNIMDALCFVLGKSSAKGLRAEKSANLIYNGGKKKTPMKEGEVSLFFDNEKKDFPLSGAEVKVSRVVKQSGQSIYKINDKPVTRSQLLDLLSTAKINPDGYNIILQGDIMHFVEMSGVERRKIIEEIGGISVYEEKRQRSLRLLDKIEEKLKEVDIIMNERKNYLKELKKERDQALKFKDLNEKLKKNKATLVHQSMKKKDDELKELNKKIDATKKKIDAKDKEITKLKEKVAEKKEELDKINKEVEEKGDTQQVKIQKEIEEIKIEHATNKTRLSNVESELIKVKERITQLGESQSEQQGSIKRIEKEKEEYTRRITNNKSDLSKVEKKIGEFKQKHDMEGAGEKEREVEDLDKEADEAQEEIQNLRLKEQDLIRDRDKLEFQINSLDEKINKVLEVSKENKKELDRLKEMKEEFKKSTQELNTCLNNDSSYSAQLANARDNLYSNNEKLSRLNVQKAGIGEKVAGGLAIQKILEQKNRIRGIYGTVSDLGFVKSEYALALEVSAGNRIRSVVVEDDKVATECITYLKTNRLGTATFLPLNKIKQVAEPKNLSKILKTAGVKGLASKLVSHDPKFSKVFGYVFGSAVIVDKLETARKIGVGSAKMVTLDGDITEVSGAMQGGFRQKSKGAGFQEKEVLSEIEKIEKDSNDLQSVISRLEKTKKSNEERIDKLREHKANLEGEIIKTEKSLHLESDDLDADMKIKEEINQKTKSIAEELDEIQNKIGHANKLLTDMKIRKQRLRSDITELKNPRLLAELNTFEQKKQELKEENIKLEAELRNFDSQIQTLLGPEVESTNKIIKQHEKELEDFKEEKKSLKSLIDEQEKEVKVKEAKQKKFYAQFKDLFSKRDKVSNEITQAETKLISLEEGARGDEQRNNVVGLDVARIKAELSGLEEEYKQYDGVGVYKDKAVEEIRREINQFERMVSDIGMVNMKALEIYDKVIDEFRKLVEKQKTLDNEREDILVMMNEIEAKKKELFMNTFDIINKNFKNKFKTLSTKGDAYLDLEDEKNPFEGGVNISVKLTGRKFMDIRSLSGGEKTLTALAFIFSIQDHEPSKFYILDEVDAALDKRNSEKLAELVRQYCDGAQYIIISHNDGVISEADNLYGVSMDEHGISKVVSLKI
ncbi:chromosome segregation protein SMC [Candidatus Woesearchaeota archaeon]|nr:chromosome segregation protein SMC [Candidatus Woesearchaeota archaeon]